MFEKEINDLQRRNEEIRKKMQLHRETREKLDAEHKKMRDARVQINLEKKISEIYDLSQNAYKKLTYALDFTKQRRQLAVKLAANKLGRNISQKPNIKVGSDFADRIFSSYEKLKKITEKYNLEKPISDDDMNEIVTAMETIEFIYTNREKLISEHVDEEEALFNHFEKTLSYHKKSLEEILSDKESATADLEALQEKINRAQTGKNVEFSPVELLNSSMVKRDFSKLEIDIGSTESKGKIYRFDAIEKELHLQDACSPYTVDAANNSYTMFSYSDEEDIDGIIEYARGMAINFLLSYPGQAKRVMAIDEKSLRRKLSGILSDISACGRDNMFLLRQESGKNPLYTDIGVAAKTLFDICANSADDNIYEYNKRNPGNPECVYLVFMLDVAFDREGMERRTHDRLYELISNRCNKYGIHLVLINSEEDAKNNLSALKSVGADGCVLEYKSGALYDGATKIHKIGGADRLNDKYFEKLSNILDETPIIPLLPFVKELEDRNYDKSLQRLVFPIGEQKGNVVKMSLNCTSTYCHVAVEGRTGSGKSGLLHAIISSSAYTYSPKELELYLFDMKDGAVEFAGYKNLKHVKVIGKGRSMTEAYDILSYINRLMQQRGRLFEQAGCNNIAAYNKKVSESERMARMLIVMDEISRMEGSDKCISLLSDIAKTGRSYGISLVIASQTISGSFKQVISQCSHKFQYVQDSESDYHLLLGDKNGLSLAREMEKNKYQCVYIGNNEGSEGVVMRPAHIADGEFESVIDVINQKYFNFEYRPPIIPQEPVAKSVNDIERQEEDYLDNNVFATLGERYLTGDKVGVWFTYNQSGMNKPLVIVGDSQRSAKVEYLVADAFLNQRGIENNADEPIVYYLNFNVKEETVMNGSEISSNRRVVKNKNPGEIIDILSRIKEIYERRIDDYIYGCEATTNIVVIIDNANKVYEGVKRALASKRRTDSFSDLAAKYSGGMIESNQENVLAFLTGDLMKMQEEARISVVLQFDTPGDRASGPFQTTDLTTVLAFKAVSKDDDVAQKKKTTDEHLTNILKSLEIAQMFEEKKDYEKKSNSADDADNSNTTLFMHILSSGNHIRFVPYE